jgi:hypothetical protein
MNRTAAGRVFRLAYPDERSIVYQPELIRLTGSVNATLLLCYVIGYQGGVEANSLCRSRDEIQEDTGLARREQEAARRALRAAGFWREERRGIPARLYYQVDLEALQAALNEAQCRQDAYAALEQMEWDEAQRKARGAK